jgi:hypothetical protein
MKFKNLISTFFLITLFACNGGGGGGENSSSVSTSSLIGTWATCENDTTTPATSYKSIITFTDSTANYQYMHYSGLDCVDANKDVTEVTNYNYTLNSTLLTSVVQTYSMTIHKQTSNANLDLDYANGASLCGFNNWAVNVAKDIMNLDCDGYVVSYGDTDSGAVAISGASLILGSTTYQRVAE